MRKMIVIGALGAALAVPAVATATIEDRLGAAVRAPVICTPDAHNNLFLTQGKPAVQFASTYCLGIRADLRRPLGSRMVDATVQQGWLFVGRAVQQVTCFNRTGDYEVCMAAQQSQFANADRFVRAAMERANVKSDGYIRRVVRAVSSLIDATT